MYKYNVLLKLVMPGFVFAESSVLSATYGW